MKLTKFFVAGAVTLAGVGAGLAYAEWSAPGTGSGAGAATDAIALVAIPETPAGANATLYPGGPAGPVFFNIQNSNPYAVTVTGLSWGTPTSTNTSACPSSNVSLDGSAPTTASISIAADTTETGVEIPGVLDLALSATNGCQGVAFDIPVTLSGTQQS
jgi:hypothetical protein